MFFQLRMSLNLAIKTFEVIECVDVVTVLPVMLSSKLLPEMEADENLKKEQLLLGMQNLPITSQIEKLKVI